jgi:8-oxo-dGTP pyrophosphatase MutT (NUDIX family)
MKKSELKALIKEVIEELGTPNTPTPVFFVHVPANVYAGKHYEHKTFRMVVPVSDEVATEEDAIRWVNNNKQQVLDAANDSRVEGGKRRVPLPVEKNLFFKPKYYVKKSEITYTK